MEVPRYWRRQDEYCRFTRKTLVHGNGWKIVEFGNSMWVIDQTRKFSSRLTKGENSQALYPPVPNHRKESGIRINFPTTVPVPVFEQH